MEAVPLSRLSDPGRGMDIKHAEVFQNADLSPDRSVHRDGRAGDRHPVVGGRIIRNPMLNIRGITRNAILCLSPFLLLFALEYSPPVQAEAPSQPSGITAPAGSLPEPSPGPANVPVEVAPSSAPPTLSETPPREANQGVRVLLAEAPAPDRGSGTDTRERRISIRLRTPNSSWNIRIRSIYRVENELWVFSEVSSRGIGATVITEVSDAVSAPLPPLPVKHFVRGKTWNWENSSEVRFIGFFEHVGLKLNAWWSGERIWYRSGNSD